MPGIHKDVKKLADRVNAIPGYSAREVSGGAHAGRALAVYGPDGFMARVSGFPSVPALALVRAEAELRRQGMPLPRLDVTPKKEDRMAATGVHDREATDAIVPRLRARLVTMGGDSTATRKKLAESAVGIIEFRHRQGLTDVEQFGSTGQGRSSPRDVARESLRTLLDHGRSGTPKSIARWTAVLAALDARGNGPAPTPVPVAAAPVPAVAPEDAGEAEDLRERAELAESVVEDLERERNAAKARAEAEAEARRAAEERASRAERAAKAAQEGSSGNVQTIRDLEQQVFGLTKRLNGQRGAQTRAVNARDQRIEVLVDRVKELERDATGKIGEIEERWMKRVESAETRAETAEGHKRAAQNSAGAAMVDRDAALERAEVAEVRVGELEVEVAALREQVDRPPLRQQAMDGLLLAIEALGPVPALMERVDKLLGIETSQDSWSWSWKTERLSPGAIRIEVDPDEA